MSLPRLNLYRLSAYTLIFAFTAASACSSSNPQSGQPQSSNAPNNSNDVSSESSNTSSESSDNNVSSSSATAWDGNTETLEDITNAIFAFSHHDCATYRDSLFANVEDIQNQIEYETDVSITSTSDFCTLQSNSLPNHDFNDSSARFATPVSANQKTFTFARTPSMASANTDLSQQSYDAVFLNGVVVDLLSAGCYRPSSPMADRDGNVPVGCSADDPWLSDPLGTESGFGTDQHNAHTQPDGTYHYHGNPNALFDDNPGPGGSPVIGFAADGFPIYGSYFLDDSTGQVRKAISGYTLRPGQREGTGDVPSGNYDGTYIDDYEYTNAGDLDECNGMTVNGNYGYYVTDSYPWVLKCFKGVPHNSFRK